MPENRKPTSELISERSRRRILGGVSAGHFLVLVLVLTFSVIGEWLNKPEETITVEFYDPNLTNVVENPSPDPAPDNPIPPTGTQDGGAAETPLPEPPQPEPPQPEPPQPEPPRQIVPETAETVVQPEVTQRKRPRKINKPKQVAPAQAKAVKQPDITKRKRPGRKQTPQPAAASSKNTSSQGKPGPRGSNRQQGHTAPGGQRGNSGYDQVVAGMIYRMWITPDKNRIIGKPQVGVELVIAADGRVIRKRITHRSGQLAMDESIQNLLDNLHRVIVPFDRQPHTLRFAIIADD